MDLSYRRRSPASLLERVLAHLVAHRPRPSAPLSRVDLAPTPTWRSAKLGVDDTALDQRIATAAGSLESAGAALLVRLGR